MKTNELWRCNTEARYSPCGTRDNVVLHPGQALRCRLNKHCGHRGEPSVGRPRAGRTCCRDRPWRRQSYAASRRGNLEAHRLYLSRKLSQLGFGKEECSGRLKLQPRCLLCNTIFSLQKDQWHCFMSTYLRSSFWRRRGRFVPSTKLPRKFSSL